ncbi:MAG: hypothetical protein ABIG61_13120 [Planctomycetota bacterium]
MTLTTAWLWTITAWAKKSPIPIRPGLKLIRAINSRETFVHRKINYMLRKTLIPWRFQQTIDEVVEYCKTTDIDEVMWKIDAEVFNRGFTSIELIRQYLPWLEKAKKALHRIGVTYSINPWITLNHADYGRDSRKNFSDMQWMVGHNGTQSNACPCPLSDTWHKYIVDAYCLYAQTQPAVLWLEDDFRHFNHSPVDWACFCTIHLERFSEIIGEKVSREQLVKAILKPGKPHPWRKKWMDFLGRNMIDVAEKIEKAVHVVSPQTKLGLMSSCPQDHSIEGRNWHKLLKTLAGPHEPISRPAMGSYRSVEYFDIYPSMDITRQTIHCLPPASRPCSEIENAPFTQFVKSVRFTRLQILLAAAAGCDDHTMNLYDHAGTPLLHNDPYGIMLKKTKPLLNSLLQYRLPAGKEKGIGLLFPPDIAKKVETTQGKDFTELYPRGSGWAAALQCLGFPVTYHQTDLFALTGRITQGLDKKQTENILSKSVLLDASAAQTLCKDGFAELIGLHTKELIKRPAVPISAEDIGDNLYISARLAVPGEMLCRFEPHQNSRIFTNFVDCNRQIYMPSVVFCENKLGGKIASFAMDMSHGPTACFMSWHRKKQFKQILDWLAGDNLDLFVSGGPHALPLLIDYKTHCLIVIANNCPDAWPEITVELATNGRNIYQILMLTTDAKWTTVPLISSHQTDCKLTFTAPKQLEYMDIASFCIKFSNK